MRQRTVRLAVAGAVVMVGLGVSAIVSAQQSAIGERDDSRGALSSLGWLAGTWSGEQWGGTFTAHYSAPADGTLLSYSRLFREGAVAYYEFEVFEADGRTVTMSPFPGGKRADGFTLIAGAQGENRAVFENREKDYPTRITYEREGDATLVITLDDPYGESGKSEVFRLERSIELE